MKSWFDRMVAFLKHIFIITQATIRKLSDKDGMLLATAFYSVSSVKEMGSTSMKSGSDRTVAFLKFVFFTAQATIRKFSDEEGMHLAAGIAYYALLSFVPGALLFVIILSYFVGLEEITTWLADILGKETPISRDFLLEIMEGTTALRGPLGIIGLFGLILTATLFFAAVMRAINRAWGLIGTGTRSFIRRKLWEFSMLTGTAILFAVSFAGSQLFRLLRQVRFPGTEYYLASDSVLWSILTNLFFFATLSLILFLLYMWVPTVTVKVNWRKALLPGLLAALAIMITNYLSGWYFKNWAYYNTVYTSLTNVIVLLLWVYVCSNILIIGAALSSVLSTLSPQPPNTDPPSTDNEAVTSTVENPQLAEVFYNAGEAGTPTQLSNTGQSSVEENSDGF